MTSNPEPCLGIVCACLPTMTPILRKYKLLKSEKSSNSHTYYDNYNRAALDVAGNSEGNKSCIPLDLRRGESEDSSTRILRESQYGTSAGRSKSIGRPFPSMTLPQGDGDIYALTTIDVEEHPARQP